MATVSKPRNSPPGPILPPPLPKAMGDKAGKTVTATVAARRKPSQGKFLPVAFAISASSIAFYTLPSPPFEGVDALMPIVIWVAIITGFLMYRRNVRNNAEHVLLLQSLSGQYASLVQVIGATMASKATIGDERPEDSTWSIKKDGIERIFEPGRILRVNDTKNGAEHIYTYAEDGTVTCDVYQGDIRRYCIRSSVHGAPLKGIVYGDDGQVKVEYEYNIAGQLSSRMEAATVDSHQSPN